MKHTSWLSLSLATFGCLIPFSAEAQVTPDGTTSTVVNGDGNNFIIEQGDRTGNNLFHSFNEFSVPTLGSAVFNNAGDVANIFSRVTGNNISSIDGMLGANGTANLYLINPNGIIFGENARLDLGGSFFASTADSLLFEGDTEFSAVNPQAAPLLEVSIPIGLSFRDNPGDIVNSSRFQNSADEIVGLEVNSGSNLAFTGRNINFEAGIATAQGGNIYLGGLTEAGIVTINENNSLAFPEGVLKTNINFINDAGVDVRSSGGGSITIDAQNLSLAAGEFGSSFIQGGIASDSTSEEAQAGNISINVIDNITLNNSVISNDVDLEGGGNSGNITINTNSLELIDGLINNSTFGQGNAGAVNITALDNITFTISEGATSGIISFVGPGAIGNSGDITISASNLNLDNGGAISASTLGQGNSGNIIISASNFNLNNGGAIFTSSLLAVGNSGDITISAFDLNVANGSLIDASTGATGNGGAIDITATGNIKVDGGSSINSIVLPFAEGNSGGVTISASNLSLTNGSRVSADTSGQGNAGVINVNTTGDIAIDGEDLDGIASGITSEVVANAEGDSGGVTITANNLNLTNGGQVITNTEGQGNAGAVNVIVTGDIAIDGSGSGINSEVDSNAEGDSGGVIISTTNLNLTNSGRIDASTSGQGNAGAVNVNAIGDIFMTGNGSAISSEVNFNRERDSEGDSGGIVISTKSLNLANGARIDASTISRGNAGVIDITATGNIDIDGENSDGSLSGIVSQINGDAEGDPGGVIISTKNLNLTNGALVGTGTAGIGNAGAVNITATGDITVDGEDSDGFPSSIFSQVAFIGEGDSEGVTISTANLNLSNGGRVDATTFGQGNAGAINITATEDINVGFSSNISSLVLGEGDSEGLTISTTNLNLTNGGEISSTSNSLGNAGEVNITATESIIITGSTEIITFDGSVQPSPSNISASAFANGLNEFGNVGDVSISTNSLEIANGGTIEATNVDSLNVDESGFGEPGNINIEANSLSFNNQASINTVTQSETGNTANINLDIADDLSLENNSFISAQALENANGGNVTINADNGFILAFPNQNNDIIANAAQGNGGNININTQAIFGLEERPSTPPNKTNDIDASSEFGLQGDFSLNTPDFDPTSGLINLPTSVGDVSDQISQNPCQQGVGSEFIVTGKGGLPPSVNQSLNSESAQVGLIEPVETRLGDDVTGRQGENVVSESLPAQGWIFNDKGEVTLVAHSTSSDRSSLDIRSNISTCQNQH